MLIDRVLADLDVPEPEERRGNAIRGSRLGRCARQSAFMLYPEAYPPDPLPARAKLVFRFGDMIHELVRENFRRVLPGEWGMEEQKFHLRVGLTVKEAEAAHMLMRTGRLRGTIQDGATLRSLSEGKYPLHGLAVSLVPGHRRGLWLDLNEPALYVPLHVDGIADAGAYGLASVEIKSMATGSFRRALQGAVEYSYRVQMAAALDATELDTQLYVAVNKNTCHCLEICYSRKATDVRVTFTKQSRIMQDIAFDEAVGPAPDWEAAQVEHPFEPHLLEEARARVKRILMATPISLPEREYGPDFTCACDHGRKRCNRGCKGTGKTPTGRDHKPCGGRGIVACDECDGTGQRLETEAPWQCRYCASFTACYAEAKPRLEFDPEGKPHYIFTRDNYDASGITWKGPEA